MATPLPLSPFLPPAKSLYIISWVAGLPPSPLIDTNIADISPLKRKRAMSEPMASPSSSGKRRRVDVVMPGQSASATSSSHPLELGRQNTFSPPGSQFGSRTTADMSSPRRNNSPSRESIAALKHASPSILLVPYDIAPLPDDEAFRDKVMEIMQRLCPLQVVGWIPLCLKKEIMADKTPGSRNFDPLAFDDSPSQCDPSLREELHYTLRKAKEIFKRAVACKMGGGDENAWCLDVIQPLLKLALRLSGKDKLHLRSVQTQAIDPRYLSTDPQTGRRLDRKADFTYSYYSYENDELAALYARLQPRIPAVSHVLDAFTKTSVLFSGIEVKPSDGGKSEAEYQISIFMSASLRKKAELAQMAGLPKITSALIEPAFVVVGHEWYFYLVYLHPDGATHVLENGVCSTHNLSGVFKVLKVLRGVVGYGLKYWDGYLKPVLEKLADEEMA